MDYHHPPTPTPSHLVWGGWRWPAGFLLVLKGFLFSPCRILNLRGESGEEREDLHVNLLGLVLDDGSIISIVSP